jgi:hypothetical protein
VLFAALQIGAPGAQSTLLAHPVHVLVVRLQTG